MLIRLPTPRMPPDIFKILVLISALAILRTVHAQVQDCYYYNGIVAPNGTVCPGSGACCNAEATCTKERLCHNAGDPADVFVRGPCVRKDWSSTDCPQICLYGTCDRVYFRDNALMVDSAYQTSRKACFLEQRNVMTEVGAATTSTRAMMARHAVQVGWARS